MNRTDDANWSIAERVGPTALNAAEARTAEADRDSPLFVDTCARALVTAATRRGWSSPLRDGVKDPTQVDTHTAPGARATWDFVAARTRWFDDYFEAASLAGARQVVILAAGLDARAWRLGWEDDTAIFEVDQPQVLAFKTETLSAFGIAPGVRYLPVPADLREDWPKELCNNGFDPDMPTAWAAEGLLVQLPVTAQHRLFNRIQRLSATGSFVAVDGFGDARSGPDCAEATTWLAEHGWSISTVGASDMMARYHRSAANEYEATIPRSVFVDGQLL